jgi:glycosyltransferase involved in cell wall biosynthesis
MRIAVVNWSRRKVGGVETYLSTIIPELSRAGHDLAFWSEVDEPVDREQIQLSRDVPAWSVSALGVVEALAALRDWRPQVIYTHKVLDPKLEADILSIAPSVFFAHDYYGTCISGNKSFKFPTVRPCSRRFGWQCLLNYFPRRCGGRSPVTMVKLYRLQSSRLELLRRYDAVVTHSDHMLSEYMNHGLSVGHAYNFPYYVKGAREGLDERNDFRIDSTLFASSPSGEHETEFQITECPYWRLLFSGRMELLKGGHVFLEALPLVAESLDRPLRIVLAGDGRERRKLERVASRIQSSNPEIEIEFIGWISHPQMESLIDDSDLLVVPSLWPEPFGLVGPEAGQHGVPVAAFAVGGIRDWLKDGINGHLAPGDPPTPAGLAAAIVECLRDPAHHAKLRSGAMVVSKRFSLKNHLTALEKVFEEVLTRRAAAAETPAAIM